MPAEAADFTWCNIHHAGTLMGLATTFQRHVTTNTYQIILKNHFNLPIWMYDTKKKPDNIAMSNEPDELALAC